MGRREYVGYVDAGGRCVVRVGAESKLDLDPRYDLRNHSPTGFQWGYGGSGPAQLALAILADAIDDERALELYQRFKFAKVASWPQNEPFTITRDEVVAWCNAPEQLKEGA